MAWLGRLVASSEIPEGTVTEIRPISAPGMSSPFSGL